MSKRIRSEHSKKEEMSKVREDIILQLYARTPSPCRDYCGLTITKGNITLNIWNITFGPHVYPKRLKCSLEDLNENKSIKMEIERVFGKHVLGYANSLYRNEKKLENLSTKAFLSILNYLAAKDILNLSQTSKIMFERCNDDNIWSIIFRKVFKTRPSQHDLLQIERNGWKCFVKENGTFQNVVDRAQSIDTSETKALVNNKKVENKPKLGEVKSVVNLTNIKPLNYHNQNKSVINLASCKQPSKTLSQVKNEFGFNQVKKAQEINQKNYSKKKLIAPETKNVQRLK